MSVFSPLALTQALPFLPLAQGDIDYEVSRRGEPDLFDTALLEPQELAGEETLRLGAATLKFVPFCGPDFSW